MITFSRIEAASSSRVESAKARLGCRVPGEMQSMPIAVSPARGAAASDAGFVSRSAMRLDKPRAMRGRPACCSFAPMFSVVITSPWIASCGRKSLFVHILGGPSNFTSLTAGFVATTAARTCV